MTVEFEKTTFKKRLTSMLGVDFRRLFTSPLWYIMLAIALVMPILILVMTTMMGVPAEGTEGETASQGFTNAWQIIGSFPQTAPQGSEGAEAGAMAMSMDLTSMCNINMMFFIIAIFVALFVGEDFKSGYAKNLFTVRAQKVDYVLSKTLVCFIAGAGMIIVFFLGGMIGGAIAKLPFTLEGGVSGYNLAMCILSKTFLTLLFSAVYILACVIAKQKTWLSILLCLGIGMLFFTMIPMITPLNAGIIHLVLCLIGSAIFAIGIGAGSTAVLKKTALV